MLGNSNFSNSPFQLFWDFLIETRCRKVTALIALKVMVGENAGCCTHGAKVKVIEKCPKYFVVDSSLQISWKARIQQRANYCKYVSNEPCTYERQYIKNFLWQCAEEIVNCMPESVMQFSLILKQNNCNA